MSRQVSDEAAERIDRSNREGTASRICADAETLRLCGARRSRVI